MTSSDSSEYEIKMSLIDYKNVDSDNYLYENPSKSKDSSTYYESNCYYEIGENTISPLFFETKKLNTPTGIYKIGNEYMIDLEIPRGSSLLDFLMTNDEINVNAVVENKNEWFSSDPSYDEIMEKYNNALLFKNQTDNPILRVNLQKMNNEPKLDVSDELDNKLDYSHINSNTKMACILRLKGIKFLTDTFHPIYIIYKVKIFNDDEELEEVPDFQNSYGSDSEVESDSEPETFVNDSDTESLDDDELENLLKNLESDEDTDNESEEDDDTEEESESEEEEGEFELDELNLNEINLNNNSNNNENGGDDEELEEEESNNVSNNTNLLIQSLSDDDLEF